MQSFTLRKEIKVEKYVECRPNPRKKAMAQKLTMTSHLGFLSWQNLDQLIKIRKIIF